MTLAMRANGYAAIAQLVEHLICNQGNLAHFQSLPVKRIPIFRGLGKRARSGGKHPVTSLEGRSQTMGRKGPW